ncbi:hypothetical protein Q5692_27720 [Microcoleus sp. C2C3]|uniref:hypothetical protein n=1 Tax=unclassified Microcoleus TaxID=2642155 RepID=UPI002FD4D628
MSANLCKLFESRSRPEPVRVIELANSESRSTQPVRAIELANNQSPRSRTSRAIAARLWDNAIAKATSQLF